MSRRQVNKKRPSLGSIIFLVFVIIAFIAAIGVGAWMYFHTAEYDKETACRKAHGGLQAKEQVVFLFDVTDKLNEDVADRLRLYVSKTINKLPSETLIEFYVLDDRISNYKADYLHCIPLKPEEAGVTDNAEMVKKEFNKKFKKQLTAAIDRLSSSTKTYDRSPICEMIKAVVLQSFGNNKVKVMGSRRLIVISDFMHHLPGHYSMYRDGIDFEKFKKSAYGSGLLLDSVGLESENIEAELWYTKSMTPANANFWKKYFEKAGITVERAGRI